MIKLNIVLFFISLIVATQVEEIDPGSFLKNGWLSKNAPKQYQKADKNLENWIKETLQEWNSKTIEGRSKLDSDINEMRCRNEHTRRLIKDSIIPLDDDISRLKSKIIPSLYPYFDSLFRGHMFSHFIRIYLFLTRCLYIPQGDREKIVSLKNEIDKVRDGLKESDCDLNKVLFYSLITKSENAAEHRLVHSKTKNRLNNIDVVKKCSLCISLINNTINSDDYVFSLLCGHQIHVSCMKNYFSENKKLIDQCLTCGKNVWDGIEVEESALFE